MLTAMIRFIALFVPRITIAILTIRVLIVISFSSVRIFEPAKC
jgi:hypothetical protein